MQPQLKISLEIIFIVSDTKTKKELKESIYLFFSANIKIVKMGFSLIIENSDSLLDRYKNLSLMELGLFRWDLVEYYENDFKEVEASEMIFRTLKLTVNISKMQMHLMLKIFLKHLFWDK